MVTKEFVFQKIKNFLDTLSSRPNIGGLSISDSGIQYLVMEKGAPKTFSFRFAPGVVQDGKVINASQFLKALRDLYALLRPKNGGHVIPVIVSLPPMLVYTQALHIPQVDKSALDESARLNLQMISPIPVAEAYISYEVITETPTTYELLGAFAEKNAIDSIWQLLHDAHFYVLAFEFPALALARLVRKTVWRNPEPIVVLQVLSDGLDFLIIRNGALYFAYFRSWRSIQGDRKEIPRSLFDETMITEVQKVINFAISRFHENVKQAFIIAPGFDAEIKGIIEQNFHVPAVPLALSQYAAGPSWYAVLGTALRGAFDRDERNVISLSAESSAQLYHEEQMLNFIRVWRNIVVGAAALFLLIFGIAAMFLVNQSKDLEVRLLEFKTQLREQEFSELIARVAEFNATVGAIADVRAREEKWHPFLKLLKSIADAHNVTLNNFSLDGLNREIAVSAIAPNQASLLRFKNTLVKDEHFRDVDLPLSQIIVAGDTSVRFAVRFWVNREKFQ